MKGVVAALLCMGLAACDRGPSHLGYGEPCARDRQCETKLCVAAAEGVDQGRCTRSCASDSDCPQGSSCRGATNEGVVVCLPGPAVPFGVQ